MTHPHRSRRLHSAIAGALISLSFAGAPSAALAQDGRSQSEAQWRSPRITGFDVEQVAQLSPGTDLAFTVYGTPGMRGRLQIDGATRAALLDEVSAGQYRGWYTIGSGDRINPGSRVTANLRDGSRVATATLDENLVRGYAPDGSAGAAPAIERFTVRPAGNDRKGRELVFELQGTPGGQASVRMRGTQERLSLQETGRAGTYTGTYPLSRNDRLDPKEPFVARLRVGGRTVTSQLTADAGLLPSYNVVGACRDCGTVAAIRSRAACSVPCSATRWAAGAAAAPPRWPARSVARCSGAKSNGGATRARRTTT
jgi:hypothetical protein